MTADASGSTDTDATPIATYTFDFGDGTPKVTQPGAILKHTYTAIGDYTVTLTVTDTAGNASAAATRLVSVTKAPPSPIRVSAGYYETHHPGLAQPKPDPWLGSPGVVFAGTADPGTGGWDTSAVKIDNLTAAPITGVTVTVDIGSQHYALWAATTIPLGGTLILAQTGYELFDGSDHHPAGCVGCDPTLCTTAIDSSIPLIHVTFAGTTLDYHDTGLVLSTGGVDRAGCPSNPTRNDESKPWEQIPT